MKFEWDEVKRQTNLRDHNLDFADAEIIFSGIVFTFEDDRFAYGEDRFITMGLLRETVVVIAHTERNERVRLISMRKATRNEQRLYFENF
jgi:hypothetical protein